MNRKKSMLIAFLLGVFCGLILAFTLALYNVHKDKGLPLLHPKTYGNIRIIPSEVDETLLPDTSMCLLIENQNENLACLFFNKNKNVSRINILNKGEIIMSASLSSSNNSLVHIGYGDIERQGEVYYDIDGNASLDFLAQRIDAQDIKSIYVDHAWVKADECNFKQACVTQGAQTINYIFEEEYGWKKE